MGNQRVDSFYLTIFACKFCGRRSSKILVRDLGLVGYKNSRKVRNFRISISCCKCHAQGPPVVVKAVAENPYSVIKSGPTEDSPDSIRIHSAIMKAIHFYEFGLKIYSPEFVPRLPSSMGGGKIRSE